MKLITLDFETYYSKEYSLSKMTTEEYIRDPRFETLIVGIQVDNSAPYSVHGTAAIDTTLDSLAIEDNAVLCHHAHFDGLILSHHFGHRPRVWLGATAAGDPRRICSARGRTAMSQQLI